MNLTIKSTKNILSSSSLKGTVSPDIGLNTISTFCKTVYGFYIFFRRSSPDIQILILELPLSKQFLILQIFPKAVLEFMFRLTDVCLDQLDLHCRVSVSRVCSVNRVSESRFTGLLASFRKPDMTV
jgi:hypothetical protein